jgi:hypothetical protein
VADAVEAVLFRLLGADADRDDLTQVAIELENANTSMDQVNSSNCTY